MARRSTLETRLPPMVFGEVYAMAKSNRYTIRDLVFLVQERGFVISKSAMGRFMIRVRGPEGIVRDWMAANPEKIAALAALIEDDPAIDFSHLVRAPGGHAE